MSGMMTVCLGRYRPFVVARMCLCGKYVGGWVWECKGSIWPVSE